MHPRGSKDVWRANGMSPRVGSSPELPGRLVVSLRYDVGLTRDLDLSCTKGDPIDPNGGSMGVC